MSTFTVPPHLALSESVFNVSYLELIRYSKNIIIHSKARTRLALWLSKSTKPSRANLSIVITKNQIKNEITKILRRMGVRDILDPDPVQIHGSPCSPG